MGTRDAIARITTIIGVILLVATTVIPQEENSTTEPNVRSEIADNEDVPQSQSSEPAQSNRNDRVRDPFWPVEYDPDKKDKDEKQDRQAEINEREEAQSKFQRLWKEAQEEIEISGISKMGREHDYFAMVNNRMVREGDTISIKYEGHIFRWRVKKISANGISLERAKRSRIE